MIQPLKILDLGLIPYLDALKIQENLFNEQISNKSKNLNTQSTLILCEHLPVYTMGKNANAINLLKASDEIPVVNSSRGGDITYHGPGQLVIYPIIDLEIFQLGIAKYVYLLEQAGIDLCSLYHIKAHRLEGKNGVWINNERKIMAIGIKASRHITMHGLAININTDLKPYHDIVPCGITDKSVTSLQAELGKPTEMETIKEQMVSIFNVLLQQ